MKFSWHLLGQVVATTLQGINQFKPFIPEKYNAQVTFAVLVLQALAGLTAHFYTPTGEIVKEPANTNLVLPDQKK